MNKRRILTTNHTNKHELNVRFLFLKPRKVQTAIIDFLSLRTRYLNSSSCGLWLIILIILFLTSCTNTNNKEIIDRTGRTVFIKGDINRVISTAPSNTEIIADLGKAHKLVAVDRHSANIAGLSDNIALLDFFFPDAETIINLEPDLIIASGHNATGSGEDPFRVLRGMGIPVVYISMSKTIEDIYLDIAFIADVLQAGKEGETLINLTRSQVEEIKQNASVIERKKTVYFEIS